LCLAFTIYCFTHFEALLHNNNFCKHPLYCAIYCTILPVIAPPRPMLRCFSGVWRCVWRYFLLFSGRILDGWRCLKKNCSRHGNKGGINAHYCAIPRSQPPFIAYNIAQSFPHDPLYCNKKYWQYLVRANLLLSYASGAMGQIIRIRSQDVVPAMRNAQCHIPYAYHIPYRYRYRWF